MTQPMSGVSLQDKTAIVTGASRGIGLAIARALAAEGVQLGLLSRQPPPDVERATHVACDFSDHQQIPPAVDQLLARLGSIDFLINNAGTFLESAVTETNLDDWDRLLRINLTAPFMLCRQVLPLMIKAGQGRIINIASTASVQGYLHQSAYCASKHALLGFARSLAIELKPQNIHVQTVCPGGVDTDLIKGTYLAERLAGEPMIAPADIAETVVFLLKQPPRLDLPEVIIRRFA